MNKLISFPLILSLSHSVFAVAPVEFLKELVEIESGSNQVNNVNLVQDLIEARLKKIGFVIDRQKDPDAKAGDLILGTMKGKEDKSITLIAHADTVFEPESKFKGFRISDDKQYGYGPGVIDNKGGIVVMLEGLETYLKQYPVPKYTLKVLVSPNEETGSYPYVKNFIRYGEETNLVLSFEPSADSGDIFTSRRGNRWFHFKTTGKEAHAGKAFKEGINACTEMSLLAGKMAALTDFEKNVTLNIGHIKGGQDKFNIVCGHAEMKVDSRFSSVKVRDEMQRKIDQIVSESNRRQEKRGIKTATTYDIVDDSPPYSPEKDTPKYVALYLKQINAIEKKDFVSKSSGASADANYLGRKDLVILDGLGPTGKDMHTLEEAIYLPSLVTRAHAFVNFMAELENGNSKL